MLIIIKNFICLGQVHYDNSIKNDDLKNYLNKINNDNINQNENLIYGYNNANERTIDSRTEPNTDERTQHR